MPADEQFIFAFLLVVSAVALWLYQLIGDVLDPALPDAQPTPPSLTAWIVMMAGCFILNVYLGLVTLAIVWFFVLRTLPKK